MENYLKEMLVTLTESGVKFVVGGGVACALQGVERVTLDLDIAVEVTEENLNHLREAVDKLGLQPRVPVSLLDIADPQFVRSMIIEKGALVLSVEDFSKPLRRLDIFLSPALSYERLAAGANSLDIGGAQIRVASKEVLMEIKSEIQPPRAKDSFDLQALAKLIEESSE